MEMEMGENVVDGVDDDTVGDLGRVEQPFLHFNGRSRKDRYSWVLQ
jgi:hypothetical protein